MARTIIPMLLWKSKYPTLQEEESRRDEKLKYSCKCSFLEIYNEQITDLLDPSSSNLQVSFHVVASIDDLSM